VAHDAGPLQAVVEQGRQEPTPPHVVVVAPLSQRLSHAALAPHEVAHGWHVPNVPQSVVPPPCLKHVWSHDAEAEHVLEHALLQTPNAPHVDATLPLVVHAWVHDRALVHTEEHDMTHVPSPSQWPTDWHVVPAGSGSMSQNPSGSHLTALQGVAGGFVPLHVLSSDSS
jgi:hypothetical protein